MSNETVWSQEWYSERSDEAQACRNICMRFSSTKTEYIYTQQSLDWSALIRLRSIVDYFTSGVHSCLLRKTICGNKTETILIMNLYINVAVVKMTSKLSLVLHQILSFNPSIPVVWSRNNKQRGGITESRLHIILSFFQYFVFTRANLQACWKPGNPPPSPSPYAMYRYGL